MCIHSTLKQQSAKNVINHRNRRNPRITVYAVRNSRGSVYPFTRQMVEFKVSNCDVNAFMPITFKARTKWLMVRKLFAKIWIS